MSSEESQPRPAEAGARGSGQAEHDRGRWPSSSLAGTVWYGILPMAWHPQQPESFVSKHRMRFDKCENCQNDMTDGMPMWKWKKHGETVIDGQRCITFIEYFRGSTLPMIKWTAHLGEGWMLVTFEKMGGLKGQIIVAQKKPGLSSAEPTGSCRGRWRACMTDAWMTKIPESARSSFIVDLDEDGVGRGVCKHLLHTFAKSAKSSPGEHVAEMQCHLTAVRGLELPIAPRELAFYTIGKDLLCMKAHVETLAKQEVIAALEHKGLPRETIDGIVENTGKMAADVQAELDPASVTVMFFKLEVLDPAEQGLPPLEADDDDTVPWSTLTLRFGSRTEQFVRDAQMCLDDPRSFNPIHASRQVKPVEAYLVPLAKPAFDVPWWWGNAYRSAERCLAKGRIDERFRAVFLLATVATRCPDESLALLAVDAICSCLVDLSTVLPETARDLLGQLADESKSAAMAAAEDVGAVIHIPFPLETGDKAVGSQQGPSPAVRQAVKEASVCSSPEVGSNTGFRIIVISKGTRGDVQPALVLAKALQARGCEIKFLTCAGISDFCKEEGFDALPVAADTSDVYRSSGGINNANHDKLHFETQKWLDANPGVLCDPEAAMSEFKPDAIIFTEKFSRTKCGLERLPFKYEQENGVPSIVLLAAGKLNEPRHYPAMFTRLPARPLFIATSRLIETGGTSLEGVGRFHQTGFFSPDDPTQEELAKDPLAPLVAFLSDGPAPVAFSWGSMIARGVPPAVMLVRALAAARAAGERAVVLGGWARLHVLGQTLASGNGALLQGDFEPRGGQHDDALDEVEDEEKLRALEEFARTRCHFVASAPHKWLFPQCTCVIHHGGVGTTHAVMTAGRPSIVTPVIADQFGWANKVEELKVGYRLGGMEGLVAVRVPDLVEAIRKAPLAAAAAEELSIRMRAEPGVSAAADILFKFLQTETSTGRWHRRWKATLSMNQRVP